MSVALLMSLSLLSGDPGTMKLAQAEGPLQTGRSAEDEARANALAEGAPVPPGAPADDYGLLGWCHGALSGHMQLRPSVWSEVERIERQFPNPETPVETALAGYDQQQAEGVAQIAKLDAALAAAEAQGLNRGADRSAVLARGAEIWTGAATGNPRQVAQLWMSWALPARCTLTAEKLAGQ